MNEVQIFNNTEFGEVRTILIDNEPWFVANDIGKALQYSDPRTGAKKLVDDEDKQVVPIDSAGQMRQTTIINESGLYSMIFGSTMQKAKEFKRWVTSEVLPSIRKTGGYKAPMTIPEQIQLLAQGNVELNKRVDTIQTELESLKMDLPILPIEADRITAAVKKKGVEVLGGKDSNAYHNRGLQQKVYRDIYGTIKHNFGDITTYKAIKRCQTGKAVEIVEGYKPPYFLDEEIRNENAQQKLDV